MYPFEPVKKVYLSEEIGNRLLEQIKNGYFRPGEKLPSERELCETFDASRTTIREAIKGLTSMGVINKQRDGNHVCTNLYNILSKPFDILLSTTEFDIEEIAEARISIECQLVKLSALRVTHPELAAMEECLQDDGVGRGELMKKSIRFHKLIASSTKNRVLEEMYSVIYRILSEKRENEDSLKRVHESQKQHRVIFEAIRDRDPERAEAAMREHLSKIT